MHEGTSPARGNMLPRSLLETAAIRFRHQEAIFCASTGRRFTFGDLDQRANQLANGLLGLDHPKGAVVAFLCSNRAEIADIYFALAKTGMVGLPLNYRLAPQEVIALVAAMGATTLIVEERFGEVAQRVRAQVPTMRHLIWIGPGRPGGDMDYDALLAAAPPVAPDIAIEENDPYYLNLTSGTTGLPKSYVLTHYNVTPLLSFFPTLALARTDVILTALPAFGRIGMAWLVAGITYGARNVLMNFEPREALRLIATESVTVTNLVPTMAAMLLAAADTTPRPTPSLRAIVFAGSMLPAPIREQSTQRLCPLLYEYYGMQETGALVVSDPSDRRVRPDSVGRVILYSRVRIVTSDGRDAPTGEIGEVLGRSPAATTAYFQDTEKSAQTFRDGWIHTGDLGRLDADGYLYICGRVKDMIITGGQNVHAAEVEEALTAYPAVVDCAVIGTPDDVWGELVTAVVVVASGGCVEIEPLQNFCRARIASFKIPRRLHIQHDALPRTATGKVQKYLLVERYKTGAADAQ